MKAYIWQNNKGNKWHVYWDMDHPLGWQMSGISEDLTRRCVLSHDSCDYTATFRFHPTKLVGEIFNNKGLVFYQFLLERDHREEKFDQCILVSKGKWLSAMPGKNTIQYV